MIIKAKTDKAYAQACNLPFSLPLPFPNVDVDPSYLHVLDLRQFETVDGGVVEPA